MNVLSKPSMRNVLDLKYILVFLLIFLFNFARAQDKCGTMEFNGSQTMMESEESKMQFENWLKTRMSQKQKSFERLGSSKSETVYQVPVVVHIVHNGESYGDASNIQDEQIFSQIDSLNADFRRMNADQSNTPPGFVDDAADVKVEFVLAKRDPEGLPTSGIVRVLGSQSTYTINQAEILAANSYWPAEEYFNLWVADLNGGLLGFAKFPVSNVPGMDDDPNLNRLIDGVYVDYEYFGNGYNADAFSLGRTLTHEVGHWMGLRHIWGDGGCSVDDFCDDTPNQSGSTSSFDECVDLDGKDSCVGGEEDMFQNYMDYTKDECMNLFTNCQGDRMRTVLESSPRRKDLLSSQGTVAPVQVANDLGIKSIQSPKFGNCNLLLLPEIEVRNYGTNEINSFSIDLLVDDGLIESQTFSQTLVALETAFIDFSSITISSEAEVVSFKVNLVNGGSDENAENDCQWVSTFFPAAQSVPFLEDFVGTQVSGSDMWQRKNSNNNPSAWSYGIAPNMTADNESAVLSYHNAPGGSFGELDYLISPVFDLSGLSTVDLKFKYAYSGFPDNYSDALTIVVSTDCGATFPEENILFQKIGAPLTTTETTNSLFIPTDPTDWSEEQENFGEFAGNSEVVIAFIGNNGGGNNLYLDDIEVFSSAANDIDIGIVKVESVPIVSCEEDLTFDVYVKNYGKNTINSFNVSYAFGTRELTLPIANLVLESGKTEIVEIESFNNEDGDYEIEIELSDPNGLMDEDVSNDTLVSYFNIDSNTELLPIRESFTKTLEGSNWHFIREDAPADWTISDFREGNKSNYALTFKGYEKDELGIENWLVSPVLDFSETDVASMTFDISYANRIGRNDQLEIWVSSNCGRLYDIELYNKKGAELAVGQSETAWVPDTTTDWKREFIELNELAGDDDVRLAFVVTNQNGNNMYIDNIEFYVSDEEDLLTITESMRSFPNPAVDHVEVKFNFNIKEEILMRLVRLDGEVLAEQSFPNTLNQVYRIDIPPSITNGMYVLQVLGDYTNLSSKILVQQ